MKTLRGADVSDNCRWGTSRWCVLLQAITGMLLLAGLANAGSFDYLGGQEGRGYTLCDGVLKRLRQFSWTEDRVREGQGIFLTSAVNSYSGWVDPPWERLRASDHEDLLRRLILYQRLGADVYFGRKPNTYSEAAMTALNEALARTIQSGVRLHVWRTQLLRWIDEAPAPAAPQAVVELRFMLSPETREALETKYSDLPLGERGGATFLVTDDLRDLDARVTAAVGRRLAASTVLPFRGTAHFVTGFGTDVSIMRDFGNGPASFCTLVYKN